MSDIGKKEEELRLRRFLFLALSLDGHEDVESDTKESETQGLPCKYKHGDKTQHAEAKHLDENDDKNNNCYTEMTRISQIDTWDCGIACLLMIASWLRDEYDFCEKKIDDDAGSTSPSSCAYDDDRYYRESYQKARMASERKEVLSAVGTKSIWTSDLLWQLQSWKRMAKTKGKPTTNVSECATTEFRATPSSVEVDHDFVFALVSQQVMGADEAYRCFQYYQKAFEEDRSRVARTFRDLHHQGVPMIQTTTTTEAEGQEQQQCSRPTGLSMSIVIEIVRREDCLAIVLLDNRVLLGNRKATMNDDDDGGGDPPYSGHYVILCGTSSNPEHIEIANKHSGEEACGNRDAACCLVLCNPDPSSVVSDTGCMFVTHQRLEASWRATGTDEDIVFVRKLSFHDNGRQQQQQRTRGSLYRHNRDRSLSVRLKTLVRKSYFELTRMLWSFYKHRFPPSFKT